MLLKILAFATLVSSFVIFGYGLFTGDVWSFLPLAFGGVLSFALLNALADIVDCLDDIRYHVKNIQNSKNT